MYNYLLQIDLISIAIICSTNLFDWDKCAEYSGRIYLLNISTKYFEKKIIKKYTEWSTL